MLATDPSISLATSGIIIHMCRTIRNIRMNIAGDNTTIGTTEDKAIESKRNKMTGTNEIKAIEAKGNTAIGEIVNEAASEFMSKVAMEDEPY